MVGCSTESMHMSLSKLRKIVKDREAWHAAAHGLTKSWMQLRDRKITTMYFQVLDGLLFTLPVRSPRPQNFFQGGDLPPEKSGAVQEARDGVPVQKLGSGDHGGAAKYMPLILFLPFYFFRAITYAKRRSNWETIGLWVCIWIEPRML